MAETTSQENTENQTAGQDTANTDFECNICLDPAKDAVVSMCGHLFCWPCLYQWLDLHPQQQCCPVCKAAISRDKVVPLYGRGKESNVDPRDKPIPPRPQGQRSAPRADNSAMRHDWQGGQAQFQFSAGFGLFPTLFRFHYVNLPTDTAAAPMGRGTGRAMSPMEAQQEMVARCLLAIGVLIVISMLFY